MVALSILHDGRTSRKSRRSLDQSIPYKVVPIQVYYRRFEPEIAQDDRAREQLVEVNGADEPVGFVLGRPFVQSQPTPPPPRNGVVALQSSNIVQQHRQSITQEYWSLLFKRCLDAGLTKGGKTNSDVGGIEWWHCPFCEQDVRAAHLDDHLRKESHIKWYKYKWTLHYVAAAASHPDPLFVKQHAASKGISLYVPPIPASWGDARMYEWDVEYGMHKCVLCDKWATETHVSSRKHRKRVPTAAKYIKAMKESDAPRPSVTPAMKDALRPCVLPPPPPPPDSVFWA